jgi:hypothetical protein
MDQENEEYKINHLDLLVCGGGGGGGGVVSVSILDERDEKRTD